ncbi:class I SAM-dependent methyltransferase [Siccirubricoccus sp. KC 17139]|uniref:site-specific DNA-methyltransferase (adenine-specific) n=1 Tax=Siccirubricoccus soli TaxID=2899147 RepID=A0ABT1CYP7_9PROT|nr:class I SAM-dependent methyltransferase [Siccirubricoccus soli]MCO6414793.1 class I SAM-dependent methyltransferase [Siccirubricoccus soli]MCP2680923.1 class I SAM-dependent methyltransferase [Siccirubricoccus soli]
MTAEIFTPAEVVNQMLDRISASAWSDPTKTWLEPSCGEGNFLVEVHRHLMAGLSTWEPDAAKRHQHIIENMIFGVDLMPDNVEVCIDRLNARGLKHNIVCADALHYDFKFEQSGESGNESSG